MFEMVLVFFDVVTVSKKVDAIFQILKSMAQDKQSDTNG